MTDNEILMWYMKGWRSEGDCPAGGIEKIAYQRGRTDYYVGDSIPSIDNKPKEVLIAEVKEEFESNKDHTPTANEILTAIGDAVEESDITNHCIYLAKKAYQ